MKDEEIPSTKDIVPAGKRDLANRTSTLVRRGLNSLSSRTCVENIRLLIVDDIAEVRDNLATIVSYEEGITVVGRARNGLEAIELYDRLAPDVVSMNVNMPIMDGLKATRAIVSRHPNAKLFILSVDNSPDTMVVALMAGAMDFLAKPPGAGEYASTIRGLAKMEPHRPTLKLPREAALGWLNHIPPARHRDEGRPNDRYLSAQGETLIPFWPDVELEVSQEGVRNLAELRSLDHDSITGLDFSNTSFSDSDFGNVTHLQALSSLDLSCTKVTARCVESLQKFPRLRDLYIGGTLLSESELENLTHAFPDVRVHKRPSINSRLLSSGSHESDRAFEEIANEICSTLLLRKEADKEWASADLSRRREILKAFSIQIDKCREDLVRFSVGHKFNPSFPGDLLAWNDTAWRLSDDEKSDRFPFYVLRSFWYDVQRLQLTIGGQAWRNRAGLFVMYTDELLRQESAIGGV